MVLHSKELNKVPGHGEPLLGGLLEAPTLFIDFLDLLSVSKIQHWPVTVYSKN